ncbi:MAG: CARDB domain-containing protein [Desulfococcaceae bacterium]
MNSKPNLIVNEASIDFFTKTVNFTIKNVGNGDAGEHLVYVEINDIAASQSDKPQSQWSTTISELRADDSWSSGDIPFSNFSCPPERGLDIHSLTSANLVVRADAKNMVEESNESDNIYNANHWRRTNIIMNINKMLQKDYWGKPLKEIIKDPVNAIQGVSKDDAELLRKAFNIKTVRDLGTCKFFVWSQAICNLAETEDSNKKDEGGGMK